jgi:hypothetical protein
MSVSEQFLAGKPVSCDVPEVLASALCDLQNRLEIAMSENEYFESANTMRAVEAARTQMLETLKKQNQEVVQDDLAAKHGASQEEYEIFGEEQNEAERLQEEALQARSDSLAAKHISAYEDHERVWRSERKRRLYDRASQKVRILRVQQQYLLSAKRFEEAAQVCKIADRIAREETVENHYQRVSAYQQSRARLEDKHARDEDTLRHTAATRRAEMQFAREKGERRFKKRFYNLKVEEERAKDAEKLWNLAHRHDGDQVVAMIGNVRAPAAVIPKKANVATFNTLPLPPLPVARTPRREMPRGSSTRQSF